ncbi:unnamed protein product [Tuber aestivum]|uniref:CFEM domain-containing protein n=1 Tax=Tuber aestivum TaxID=59557 RepID=A0A292PQE6_9PEZI|nr:unnamed protein product [Tuber aestivum]
MKFSFVAVAVSIAAAVSAQTWVDIPGCALNCIPNNPPSGCSPGDVACACRAAGFVSGSVSCIRQNCPIPDQLVAINAIIAACTANGVNISTTFAVPEPTATRTATTGAIITATPSRYDASGTVTRPFTTGRPTAIPTPGVAGNRTANITGPITVPTSIGSAAERLTTALSLIGLSIAAVYLSL